MECQLREPLHEYRQSICLGRHVQRRLALCSTSPCVDRAGLTKNTCEKSLASYEMEQIAPEAGKVSMKLVKII